MATLKVWREKLMALSISTIQHPSCEYVSIRSQKVGIVTYIVHTHLCRIKEFTRVEVQVNIWNVSYLHHLLCKVSFTEKIISWGTWCLLRWYEPFTYRYNPCVKLPPIPSKSLALLKPLLYNGHFNVRRLYCSFESTIPLWFTCPMFLTKEEGIFSSWITRGRYIPLRYFSSLWELWLKITEKVGELKLIELFLPHWMSTLTFDPTWMLGILSTFSLWWIFSY